MLVLNLPAFENKKYTADYHFHGNGPYSKILTKKEPINAQIELVNFGPRSWQYRPSSARFIQ